MSQLEFKYGDKIVQDFVGLFERNQLNLNPGFQRDSVWLKPDRERLIQSIFQNYPIPSVFLYKRVSNGDLVYDVIDGKQRLETILMFQGVGKFSGKRFSISATINSDEDEKINSDEDERWDWSKIQLKGHKHKMMGYRIPIVEIEGDISDIISLFIKINSTGKKLTGAEIRSAKYCDSKFLKKAEDLAKTNKKYLSVILTTGQISRKKDVELVCELLASVCNGVLVDKKKAIDNIIRGNAVDGRSLEKFARQFTRILNLVKAMFPEIAETRFKNTADFYSLFMLVNEMDLQRNVLNDKKRNKQAQELLIAFSNGVDQVQEQVRKAEGTTPEQSLFKDYLLTVKGDTDSLSTRKRRADILRQILGGLFEQKDTQRNFTIEQRRIIWHSDEIKKCKGEKCGGEQLSWENFTIDHTLSYARGGRTSISNADLMCQKCNSSKGIR